jgi:hypothetical protein
VGVRFFAVVAVCAVAAWVPAVESHAAIPQGNTLLNGDGETGAAATDETSHICPQGWTCDASFPNTTLLRYGTTIFPTAEESARIGGGNSFFAGGPSNNLSGARQLVSLGEQPEVDTGAVKATFGGCLGGLGTQNDSAILQLTFRTEDDPDGVSPGNSFSTNGPKAAERGNRTTLLPVARTVAVPPTTSSFQFTLSFLRDGSGYNDGYADNLSVTFGPLAGPDPPAPPCSAPQGGGGGGGGPGPNPPGGPDDDDDGGGTPLKLLGFRSAVVGKDGKVRVRVRCNTRQVRRCKGTLSASLVKASKRASAAGTPGTASYSVASLKSRTIKIPLRRPDARKVRTLSKRALSKLRLRLRATTKVSGLKFGQTTLLKVKRPT